MLLCLFVDIQRGILFAPRSCLAARCLPSTCILEVIILRLFFMIRSTIQQLDRWLDVVLGADRQQNRSRPRPPPPSSATATVVVRSQEPAGGRSSCYQYDNRQQLATHYSRSSYCSSQQKYCVPLQEQSPPDRLRSPTQEGENSILIILLVNLHKLHGHKFFNFHKPVTKHSHIPLVHKRRASKVVVVSLLKKQFFFLFPILNLYHPKTLIPRSLKTILDTLYPVSQLLNTHTYPQYIKEELVRRQQLAY